MRTQFIIESIQDLRANLESLGSNLYVSMQTPEETCASLLDENKQNLILMVDAICPEEQIVQK